MIYAKYLGTGEGIPDIPARNLTKEEYDALSEENKAALLTSGLYELAGKTGKKAQVVSDAKSAPTEE